MTYVHTRTAAEALARHAPDTLHAYEISGERITFPPPWSRRHALNALRIRQQLDRHLPFGLIAHNGGEVEDASVGGLRRPDVIVVPDAAFAENTLTAFAPTEVTLIAEVISPMKPATAYVDKRHDYAAMSIPDYLVDPRKSTLTVFTDPGPGSEDPRYRAQRDYAFGDMITVGPWSFPTTDLRPYPSADLCAEPPKSA
jgi:Uma2 family endonuclease